MNEEMIKQMGKKIIKAKGVAKITINVFMV